MQAKPMPYVLGICLVAVMAAAGTSHPSRFEARASGAMMLELQGLGGVRSGRGDVGPGAFVLTLGAESPTGAVVFTWPSGPRPEPGVYPVAKDPRRGSRRWCSPVRRPRRPALSAPAAGRSR